jgi:beta-glucanase (GH16 family)
MAIRATFALAAALAAAVFVPAAPAVAKSTTKRTLTRSVAHPGTYDVTVSIRGRRGARVTVAVEHARPRTVTLRNGRATKRVRVRVRGRKVRARIASRTANLRARAAVRRVKTTPTAASTAKKKGAPAPVPAPAPSPSPAPSPAPTPSPAPGTLVWSDEFNAPAGTLPDPSKWEAQTGDGWGNGAEWQTYTAAAKNASTDGAGNLAITARHEPGVGAHGYTSARLESRGRYSFTYGRLEARMKHPAGQGLWPAFWAMGDDVTTVGWPNAGEIDVMEALGQDPFTAYGHIHGPVGTTGSEYSWGRAVTSPVSLASDFHNYGVVWQPGSIQWTLDGNVYATVRSTDLQSGQRWVYDHAFHLLLDLAVGGAWPGAPDASTPFPATLLVDWVRVYQ